MVCILTRYIIKAAPYDKREEFPMAKSVDVNASKKQKRRIKKIQKLAAFLLLAAVALSLYLNRNIWIPKLEGIGSRYTTITQNKGVLSEGNFPLTISGNGEYQINKTDGKLFILSEDTLYEYSSDGTLDKSWKHGLSNTILKVNDSKALIYEEGSTKFQLYNKNSRIYEEELANSILFALLSDDGYAAVITESDTFSCVLYVYDNEGQLIYTRNCLEHLMDVSFNKDSSGCILSTLGSVNGDLSYKLISSSFNSTEDNWKTDYFDGLCLNTYVDDDGLMYVIGEEESSIFSASGEQIISYKYKGSIIDYSYNNSKAALLINDENRHKMKLVLLDKNNEPAEFDFKNNLKSVHIYDDKIYIMSTDGITGYNVNGTAISEVRLNDAYNDFIKLDQYIFLIGYNQINRIVFNE